MSQCPKCKSKMENNPASLDWTCSNCSLRWSAEYIEGYMHGVLAAADTSPVSKLTLGQVDAAELQQEIQNIIEESEWGIANERLGGNIVKGEHWKGQRFAATAMRAWLLAKVSNNAMPDAACTAAESEKQLTRSILALIEAAQNLNLIVEGVLSARWACDGRRLKDTQEWAAFYCALSRVNNDTARCAMMANVALSDGSGQ